MIMESDQQFCLRWNNHQSTLISQFDTLLESETLVDCTLAAEGKYLRAHKLVLSACSPYFEALLKLHYDKHPIFVLKDVKYKELRAMMNYMYRGEVNISQDQLGALLKAAESLQIKGLSDSNIGGEKKPTRQPSPQPPPITSKSLTISKQAIKQPASALDSDGLGSPSRGRETSSSPTPRKRKKLRRRSQDDHMPDNHDPHSNTSSTHSQPANVNIPLAPISKPALDSLLDPLETLKQVTSSALDQSLLSISAVHQNVNDNTKQDPHSELIIEPKAEYGDEDGNEELSLDNVDVDDLDQSQASIEYIQDHSANDDEMTEQQRDMQGFGIRPKRMQIFRPRHRHADIPAKPFGCENCPKAYLRRRHLVRHQNVECGKDPTFQCPFCRFATYYKASLKSHLLRHNHERPRFILSDSV